ncbi:MAG: transposase, partial [Chloroflexia bacterium]|nr:transposase [Chloroflexia bacterium]
LSPAPNTRGRPEILPGALLWTGLLVCILRKPTSQQALWRLLSQTGLWHVPQVPVSAEAVRIRLQRAGPTVMRALFVQVTAELATTVPDDAPLAPFAPGVFAIDETTLDGIARTLPTLRTVPAGDDRLLPGKLITAVDVRAQQFHTVLTTDLPRQNERIAARDLGATLPVGSLILADLGYFGFEWFDDLLDAGFSFVSRLRAKTTTKVVHVLSAEGGVRDELVWLGTYRADQAKHLQRLITVPVGQTVHQYLTSVLDPAALPVADVVRL